MEDRTFEPEATEERGTSVVPLVKPRNLTLLSSQEAKPHLEDRSGGGIVEGFSIDMLRKDLSDDPFGRLGKLSIVEYVRSAFELLPFLLF